MAALLTDDILALRAGVTPPAGAVSNKLTLQSIAEAVPPGFLPDTIAPTAIDWSTAAGDIDFVTQVASATTGITPTQADSIAGKITSDTILQSQINFTGAGSDAGFVAAVETAQTPFSATSTDSSVTIAPAGTSGHTPNLSVNWAGVSADAIPNSGVDFASADNDTEFTNSVRAAQYRPTVSQSGAAVTFDDGSGTTTNIDLNAAEIFIDNATLLGTTFSGKDSSGNELFSFDFAALSSTLTNNSDGTYTHVSVGATTTVDVRASALPYSNTVSGLTGVTVQAAIDEVTANAAAGAGVSSDSGNQLALGSDGKPFLKIPTTYLP